MQEPNSSLFTDTSRSDTFKTDPQAWESASRKIVDTLKVMLQQKSFNEIFESSRNWRHQVAAELGHNTRSYLERDGTVRVRTIENNFGQLRAGVTGNGDNYVPFPVNQSMQRPIANEALFNNLVKSIDDQGLPFVSVKMNASHAEYDIKRYHKAADDFEMTLYIKKNEKDQEHVNRIETHYIPLLDDSSGDLLEIMSIFDVLSKSVLDKSVDQDKTAFCMGLLAYDFCRLCLLNRGNAAVARCILQAQGELKFDQFKLSPINGVPFDIYAQIQQDRKQYAVDFAKNIKPDFKFLPEYMTLPVIEQIFLNRLTQRIIDNIARIPRGFSLNFFSPDKKELVKKNLMAIKNKRWTNLNDALQAVTKQIEFLETDLNDQQKNEFRSIASNIKEISPNVSRENNSEFTFLRAIRQIELFEQNANIIKFSDKAIYLQQMIYHELERIDPKYKDLINQLKNLLYTPHENFLSALEKLDKLYLQMVPTKEDKSNAKYTLSWRKEQLENLINAVKKIDPADLDKMSLDQICRQQNIAHYSIPESKFRP